MLENENGIQRKRISFVNPPKENTMAIAHKYFTKNEKKIAKLNHKNQL